MANCVALWHSLKASATAASVYHDGVMVCVLSVDRSLFTLSVSASRRKIWGWWQSDSPRPELCCVCKNSACIKLDRGRLYTKSRWMSDSIMSWRMLCHSDSMGRILTVDAAATSADLRPSGRDFAVLWYIAICCRGTHPYVYGMSRGHLVLYCVAVIMYIYAARCVE